jgi:hypothetical protein
LQREQGEPGPRVFMFTDDFFVLAKSGARKKLGRDPEGRKLALARHNRACRTCFGDLAPGIRRDDCSPKYEHIGRTCLIAWRRISADCRLVNCTKDAILFTTLVVNGVTK